MKKILLAWVLLPALASADNYDRYLKELGGLGDGVSKAIEAPEAYAPRYNANPPMADQYYGGGLVIPTQFGEDKIARCKAEKANQDLYLRQECEGVNHIYSNQTQKPDVTISANEKLVSGTQSIAGDPAETLAKYRWTYPVNEDGSIGSVPASACPVETIEVPAVVKDRTCTDYTGAELFLCQASLKVTVDPNWNYSCLETKYQNETYQCNKKLNVVCEQAPDCTAAGVQAGTMQGDMQLSFTQNAAGEPHTLIFGTIGDDYWRNNQYDREFTVDVKNYEYLNVFELSRVEYDDWLVVKVNDTIVYSSYRNQMIYGKDVTKYWVSEWIVNDENGKKIGNAERKTSWKKNLNIDIRPYLKEGMNTIWTRTIVGGGGENALIFKVHQYCTPVCHETWKNECTEYEKRTK